MERGARTLGELTAGLADDAKVYARAELAVGKAIAMAYVRASIRGLALAVAALVLALAALPVLIAAFGLGLAVWVGPAFGLAIAGLIVVAVAALLGWLAARSFAAIGGKVA